MKKRPDYTRALYALTHRDHAQTGDTQVAYEQSLSVALHVLRVDHASICFVQETDDIQYQPSFSRCLGQVAASESSTIDIPAYWQHWQTHALLCCDHLHHTPAPHHTLAQALASQLPHIRSLLHVRLMQQGRLLGILRLERTKAHHWTDEEIIFAELLAEQILQFYAHEHYVQLQHELELISHVFSASRDAIIVLSSTGLVEKVNPAFTEITGFLPEEIIGHHYPTWVNEGGQTEVDFVGMCHLVMQQGHWQGELRQRRKTDGLQAVWQTMLSVKDAQGQITNFIAIESDLSSFKEAQARVHYLSYYDSLTGLANRTDFHEKLAHLLEVAQGTCRQVAVVCVDIDDFKKVNLSLGYTLGDHLLTIVATRLKHLGNHHGVWSRLSADEFACALPIQQIDEVDQLVRDIQDMLAQPFVLGGQQVRLTASVGCALYPQDALDGETLLRSAQAAMRSVKVSGGHAMRYFHSTMSRQAVERLLLENQLAQAVELGQLVLHYQPQVSLVNGHLLGLEALIRWQHPELGLVAPNVFIPLAEETGLIESIGDWVLAQACQQLAQWRDAGLPIVPIAVNISASQFVRRPIVSYVAALIAQHQLDAELIELELTERVVMSDPAYVREIMDQLSALGVSLSMDDFGTGYSSLSYLQKFPLDKLKVDMSFVRNIASSKDDLAITKAIVQLGRSLELQVIAEGVELLAQKELLLNMGCTIGQGYYFAKPLPAEQIEVLLTHPERLAQGVLS